jgi:hypothetical protein
MMLQKKKTGKVNELKICSLTMVGIFFLQHNLVVTFFADFAIYTAHKTSANGARRNVNGKNNPTIIGIID